MNDMHMPFRYIIELLILYDHHCTAGAKKIKNDPKTDNQKLFLVKSMNTKNMLIRKKKILKFHENAKALSRSKIK